MGPTHRLRVAIVGAGLMGCWHAHAAVRAGAVISAVVDRDGMRAAALARRHRGARAFAGLSEALDGADVVHICTPTSSHASLALQACGAGRHVLIEKPLAANAAETAALLAQAAAHGVLACPVHQFPFQTGVEHAFARMASIGTLRHVDVTICSAGADGVGEAARDEIARDILPHPLSLLARVLASPVDDLGWAAWTSGAGEIRASAQDGNMTAGILVSMSGRPTTNRLELIGSNGTVHADLFHGFSVVEAGRVSRLRKAVQPYSHAGNVVRAATWNLLRRSWHDEPAYPGLRTLVRLFYRAVVGDGDCPIPPAETLALARASDELRSLLGGRAYVNRI